MTLGSDNLLWLRGRAAATRRRSLSDAIDRLVTEARLGGQEQPGAIRSVVGTIDISSDDPNLDGADAYVRGLFDESAKRPALVRERAPRGRRGRG